MILTCPNCATRYFVGDDAVPAEGRTVRCAACTHAWWATPAGEAAAALAADAAAAQPALDPSPEAGSPTIRSEPAPIPKQFRAKVKAQKQVRSAVAAGAVWAVLSAAFLVIVLGAVLFKVEVVRFFPRTAGAYAAMKMPVNPTGLALEAVQGGPGLENGRAVMVVTGAVRNIETAPRAGVPLRVSLFDKAGRRAAVQVLPAPGAGPVAPGEVRPFRAVFVDPPLSASEFGVDFAFDAPRAPVHAAPAHAAPHAASARPHPALRTEAEAPPPAPTGPVHEARPLPADSPYALPPAAASASAHGGA